MKFFVLLALVGLAVCQSCDVEGDWSANQQTSGNYIGAGWEDYEIAAWGMDGGNKWQDFWIRNYAFGPGTRYDRATCFSTSQGAVPNFPTQCGSCPLIGDASLKCNCYPYYDVADNGLPTTVGKPPFEGDGPQGDWTVENCKQNKPQMVYYYGNKLEMEDGEFRNHFGISRAFTPSGSAWDDFCESLDYNGGEDRDDCHVPLPTGSSTISALTGAHFSTAAGFYTLHDGNDLDLYINQYEYGCHYKTHDRRWPSAVYCGDRAGWSYGAGAYGHVRFGCARGTFDTESTDILGIIDDSDCQAIYVGFDELNGLYGGAGTPGFAPRLPSFDPTLECWYDSDFENFITSIPSYRTPCDQPPSSGAAQLAVPLFALLSTLLLVLKNF